jgi:hypothetical protein
MVGQGPREPNAEGPSSPYAELRQKHFFPMETLQKRLQPITNEAGLRRDCYFRGAFRKSDSGTTCSD